MLNYLPPEKGECVGGEQLLVALTATKSVSECAGQCNVVDECIAFSWKGPSHCVGYSHCDAGAIVDEHRVTFRQRRVWGEKFTEDPRVSGAVVFSIGDILTWEPLHTTGR